MTGAAGDGRFVATQTLRDAVKGREGDILDALGVPWRDGRPHISCPYPDHADSDPSWRWDERHMRALCTCLRPHGILDVAMHVFGLDFAAAKLRVAELIGRQDLIRTTGQPGAVKTDPASLLAPPRDRRDDGLVSIYLAARLELDDPSAIPLPTTPIAGWTGLPFFDPPIKKGGKPKLVASPPCALFGTLAADGRRHAMRIYLAPGATGKAELGIDDRGKQRVAKKSARVAAGQASTAGCCVTWGNPDTARVILAEGPETAAAIAQSFAAEIAGGEQAVLAGVTAAGVEAFEPWPNTREITIAADRDEAKPGAGFKRGERAARALCLRLAETHPQIQVLNALPGEAGAKYDFLDLYRAAGPEGVRQCIAAAMPFQPTAAEIAERNNRRARQSVLTAVTAVYPSLRSTSARLVQRTLKI